FELIKLIFKYKPHVSKILILDTDLNYTIHLAVSDQNADLELLQLLCQNEKTINQTTLQGKTALEVAAKARNFAAVEFLLKKHT
ncbi:ankyrin repeat domain-containing protein, partial [Salmonella sp. SAL4458]|uniref:ankyrin repeat domain-containing protein n=1 Tax=Salmonella sp. SAL4458 TaxID=3159913 RepID=UPI0039793E2A